jgi:CheY-like chemotaxis protein
MTPEDHQMMLIIDDDKFLLDMYALKFREAKFDVVTAMTVEEALAQLQDKEKRPSTVLLDMIMPGVDGFEFLEQIAQLLHDTASCIIILSNQGDETTIETAKRLGAAGYILKANTIPSEVVKEVKRIVSLPASSWKKQ